MVRGESVVIGRRGGEARALGNFMEIGKCGCGEAKERGRQEGDGWVASGRRRSMRHRVTGGEAEGRRGGGVGWVTMMSANEVDG
jgi:hypothetical protein